MKYWQSYSALKRVKSETETLTAALANALETVIVTPAGEEKSLDALAGPVQGFAIIPGILQLLEYRNISLLAGEILDLLQDTLEHPGLDADKLDARLQVAFVAATDLPALLEDALKESADSFAKVFHVINQLRKCRDRAAVFDPRVLSGRQKLGFRKQYAANPDKMKDVLARQAGLYVKAGKVLLDEPQNDKALNALKGVVANMEQMFRDHRIGTLWGVAAGAIEAAQGDGGMDEKSVKAVIALAKPLHMISTGDLAWLDNVEDKVLDRMLEVVSGSKAKSLRLAIIRQWYGMDRAAVRQMKKAFRNIQVRYARKSALHKSLHLINEDITGLIDTINMLFESDQVNRDKVMEIYQRIFNLREFLVFLRMNFLAEHIDLALAPEPPDDLQGALSRAAGVLFVINKELVDKLETMALEVYSIDAGITASSTLSAARLHVYQTAMHLLETVITDIDTFVDSGCQGNDLYQARDILDELASVFTVVSLPEQRQYLAVARDYVNLVAHGVAETMPDASFHALSHLVINSLWYLEQLSIGREKDSQAYLERSGKFADILRAFVDSHPEPGPDSEPEPETGAGEAAGPAAHRPAPHEAPFDEPDEVPFDEPDEAPSDVPGEAPVPVEEPQETPVPVEDPGDVPEVPEDEPVPIKEPEDVPETPEEAPVPVEEPEDVPQAPGEAPVPVEEPVEAPAPMGDGGEDVDDDIREIFAEEFDEVLDNLRAELASLAGDYRQPQAIKDCCRYFHTLKGSGRMVGADTIGTLSLAMEKLYDYLGEKEGTNDGVMKLTGRVLETLPAMKAGFMDAAAPEPDPAVIRDLCLEAVGLMSPEAAAEVDIPDPDVTAAAVAPEPAATGIPIVTDSVPTLSESVDISGEELVTGMAATAGGDDDLDTSLVGKELEDINNRLTALLAGDDAPPTTTDLLAPLHTLYGIARLQHLENYTNAIKAMERFQEAHPRRNITGDMAVVFQAFCLLTAKLARHFARGGKDEYAELAFEAIDLEAALADLSESLGDTAGVADDAEAQDPVLAGFLREARDLVARLAAVAGARDEAELESVSRDLQLLAGAAEVADLADVEKLAAAMEVAYGRLSQLDNPSAENLRATLARCHAWLEAMPEKFAAGVAFADAGPLADELLAVLEAPEAATATVESAGETMAAQPEPEPAVEPEPESRPEPEQAAAPDDAVDQELLAIFLDEAEEILETIDGLYLRWQEGDESVIDEYLRHLHTLKGSSALVREMAMSKGAHEFETLIIDARNAKQGYDAEFFTECDKRMQGLQEIFRLYSRDDKGMIVRVGSQASTEQPATASAPSVAAPSPSREEPVVTLTEGAAVPAARPDPLPALSPRAEAAPSQQKAVQNIQAAADEQVRVSSQLLKNLMNDADEINFSRNRIEKSFNDISTLLVDMDETLNRLRSYVKRFEDKARESYNNHIEENPVPETGRISDEFDSLEMDRYTELHEMSLSLTEDYDDLQDIRMNLAGRLKDIDNVLLGQQRLTNSLQDGLISSQMVPFSSIVPRLRRLVRQISRDLKKDVRFEVDNRQGNLDKNVLQAIITPFEHIIRNALDHGIETPEQRREAGKPEQAVLAVRVTRAGASILIEIRDDGRGINVEKVKSRAIERGILDADADISHDAACQLIFKPGFSTADAVSSISGRGVGLDVVKSEITQIGGSVEIRSEQGRGTAFIIQLPLTTSLNRSLMFEVQGQRFVVLMNTLDGVKVEKLASILARQQGGDVVEFEYGGKTYEYTYLGKLLNMDMQPRLESVDTSIPMLLVSGRDRNFALHIDTIIESRDLVVKAFSKQFATMPGIGGGVIMPDGNVAVVLDLVSLVNQASEEEHEGGLDILEAADKTEGEARRSLVMVVDDSITVRKVTSSTLKRHGLEVITAKNGLEAIEQLGYQVPDVILLDIEMPKMDGFEVATHIRKQAPPVGTIPIIMITSRIGDKHRTRAQEIGVNEFMSKPFVEEVLIEHIRSYQKRQATIQDA